MNDQQLKRGNEIKEKLPGLKEAKERWQAAQSLTANDITARMDSAHKNWNIVPGEYITPEGFKILKILVIENLTKQIDEMESEYKSL